MLSSNRLEFPNLTISGPPRFFLFKQTVQILIAAYYQGLHCLSKYLVTGFQSEKEQCKIFYPKIVKNVIDYIFYEKKDTHVFALQKFTVI